MLPIRRPVVERVPATRLRDLVLRSRFVIVDLDHPGPKKAPYAVPVENASRIVEYAGERNVALLTDAKDRAESVASAMRSQAFKFDITLTGRSEWVDLWAWDD